MISSIDWFQHGGRKKSRAIQYGEAAAVGNIPEVHEVNSGMDKVKQNWLLIVSHKTRQETLNIVRRQRLHFLCNV